VERVAEITVRLECGAEVAVSFCDPLEVSTHCPVCRRFYRTVVFREGLAEGKCTPTGHAFPGRITGKRVGQDGSVASVVYAVRYRYEPFTDAKFPGLPPSTKLTWGRVAFEVSCPACGRATKASTQTNMVRPYVCRCECGAVLYTDCEPPMLASAEAPEAEQSAAPDRPRD
jgi:hypothetical protein